MKINLTKYRRRFRLFGDRDPWKITIDPYRDWRRLLWFGFLGLVAVVAMSLYFLLAIDLANQNIPAPASAGSSTWALLLDRTAIDRAAAIVEEQNREFETWRLRKESNPH